MAKASNNRGDGRSKFRVVMIEGDLAEGDLREMTQAITNALRPTPVIQRLAAPARSGSDLSEPEIQDAEILDDDDVGAEDAPSPKPRERGPARPRAYASPKVLDDVDLNSPVSFPDFAAEKRPESLPDKYLTVAAWFKLHRNIDEISMHHVYTCFLHPRVKWPTAVDDFDALLRYHKKRNRMKRAGKGLYAINHIGLAEVEALGSKKAEA